VRTRSLTVLTLFAVAGLSTANGQEPSSNPDYAALARQVERLQEVVQRLEQRVEELQAASGKQAGKAEGAGPAPEPGNAIPPQLQLQEDAVSVKEQPTLTAGRDTFSIISADGLFRLRIGGHLQVDGKTFYDNKAYYDTSPHQLTNSFYIRRARPILEGDLGHDISFRFVPDFGNGKTLLYDAYADLKVEPYLVLRGGKFKTPEGLEELQNDADLTFIERSLATDLVPNRDEGLQIYGDLQGRASYQLAAVNGAPVGQNVDGATFQGKTLVGRLVLTPYAPAGLKLLQGLGVGVAASTGQQDGAVLPSFITSGGQAAFFSYGSGSGSSAIVPVAAGNRINYAPQMYWYEGPFGLMAEYTESVQKVSAAIAGQTVPRNIADHAWQMAGSWVLTGEKKSLGSVAPRKGAEWGRSGGLGAWEVVARYAGLNVDPSAFTVKFADPTKSAQAARTWTAGLNWYLNYFVKLQFNYEQTHFQGGNVPDRTHPLFSDRPTEKVFEQRLQFAF
jgi:phosphate-selective porin OprO/OprP